MRSIGSRLSEYGESLQDPVNARTQKHGLSFLWALLIFPTGVLTLSGSVFSEPSSLTVSVTYDKALSVKPLDGRLLLLFSKDGSEEPRFQISGDFTTQQVYGVDVDEWKPGAARVMDKKAFGFPLRRLSEIKPGEYFVQAVLDVYDTYTPAHGHTIKLPVDRGEGRQWNKAPGNLFSKPMKVTLGRQRHISLKLDQVVPLIQPPKDTKYIKHLRVKNERLSQFWGRPVYLGANVLLPEGFDAHPEAKYPVMIFHGHFPADFSGFRTEPPDANLKPDYNERFRIHGYNRIQQEEAYNFFKTWTGPNFPRFLVVEIQHANPFYDDSYAVNSANLGPYGDAITYDLIPHIEKQFRGIGQGWARFLYGGSTGGWEALAAQVFYPDEYNGAFAACPDPIDFRAYTVVNIYEDKNFYFNDAPFMFAPRSGARDELGRVKITAQDLNYLELALGSNSRSGEQFDIWEAVYSPVGSNGFPARLYDKMTGAIDAKIADYWRDNYDLGYILKRDWATLGPKLRGKLHIYVGEMDNYFLNNAVYLVEDFLKTANPPSEAEVAYGARAEHCWGGDPAIANGISRLRYNTKYVSKIMKRIEASAPKGADLKSWRY